MRAIVLLGCLALMACGDGKAEILEKEYADVSRYDPLHEGRCRVARRLEDAWLERRNEAKYREWAQTREGDCFSMRLGVP